MLFRWHSSVVVDIDNTPVHPPLVASIPFEESNRTLLSKLERG
ncbi:unnamed protein product [Brassica oleracea]